MTNPENPFLVPRIHSMTDDDGRYDVKSTGAWIATLPMGDAVETGHELIRRLLSMNRVEMPPRERIHSLEALFTPLSFVFEALAERALKMPLPLSKRQLEQLGLTNSLHALLVQGYKSALEQFHHASELRRTLNKRSRTLAAHRALYHLGGIILNSYRRYQSPLPFAWLELHGIYNYAYKCGLHNGRVADEEEGITTRSSCTDLYKRTLMLATANPYRLQRREIELVTRLLGDWAPQCQLHALKRQETRNGLFLVDPGADAQPKYRGAANESSPANGWLLDTTPLSKTLSRLHKQLDGRALPTDHPNGGPPLELLSRLMFAWGIHPERRVERESAVRSAYITCGVEAVVRALCKDPAQDGPPVSGSVETPLRPEELDRMGWNWSDAPAVHNFDYSTLRESNALSGFPQNRPTIEPGVQETHSCTVCDQSSLGLQLKHEHGTKWETSVGDLIGIEITGESRTRHPWQLGIVRWMRVDEANETNFGIQLLEGLPEPVLLRPVTPGKASSAPLPGLLLFANEKPTTLILSPHGTTEQLEFSFLRDNTDFRIELGRTVESTNSFTQYQFRARTGKTRSDTGTEGAAP